MVSSIIIFVFALYFIQRMKPVKDLKHIDIESLSMLLKEKSVSFRVLDVRDQVDYHDNHIEGAINISLGRLPYVNKKEFDTEDEIFLISDSKYHSKRAARILKRSGFQNLTHVNEGMQGYMQVMNGQRYRTSNRLRICNGKCC
ncbi:rhodanese-like domain-containing protein [Paenibacillus hexagrammi]|uniref:Rhodanese-like domain-containing protein n=1 Tax=Paenibacillus hexagrammi TaxID=2908839 RepID=A0ABY3SPA6_9BACL|nr:rhodanese-like domain-containing protein [Paenibacillus sp. YPD9-1]UJF35672.1 rhodanese-like domain-containing protein [Paenibacillus sp. YPD9-1]